MNTEVLVALFTGTGLATVIGVIYTIVKERRGNAQKDAAGDLALGELFREAARREVTQVQSDMTIVQAEMRALRARSARQNKQIRELREYRQKCEDTVKTLLERWPDDIPPPRIDL